SGKQSNVDGNSSFETASLSSVFVPTFILEYVDDGKNEGFQLGQDEIVGFVNIGALDFDTEKTEETLKDKDGEEYTVYHVVSTSTTGLIQFNFTVSDHPASINSETVISAEQTKIDFGIDGYYNETTNPASKDCDVNSIINRKCVSSGPSDKNSTLALVSFYAINKFGMKASLEQEKIEADNKEQGFHAGFNWVKHARYSHKGKGKGHCKVHADSKDDDNGLYGSTNLSGMISGKSTYKLLSFSFSNVTRPDQVAWDPVLGGAASEINNGTSSSN
ncbi:hypothetical protein DICPUDRAFT_18577, partial [Dictyostelium purpureum]